MDEDVVAVVVFLGEDLAIVVVEPGVDGVLVEHGILHLELELVAQEGVAAAGVHHHLRADAHLFPVAPHGEAHHRLLGAEIDGVYPHAFVNRRAQLVGVLQQHQVELAAIHMVGVVLVDARLFALVKANVGMAIRGQALPSKLVGNLLLVVRSPDRAKLVRKLCLFHLRKKIEVFENARRRRDQRLADVRARKQLALKHDATHAGLGQIGSHGRPGRPTADNRDIEIWLSNHQGFIPAFLIAWG